MPIVRSVLFSLLLSLPSAFGSDTPEPSGDLPAEGAQCQVTQQAVPFTSAGIDAELIRFDLYRHVPGAD